MVDFLRLNGLPVMVADSGSDSLERRTFEGFDRMFDGSPSRRRIAEKRSWRFTTIPLPAESARALEAVLQGRVEGWPFDADAWSSRPLTPSKVAGRFANYRLSGAADGRASFADYTPNHFGKGIENGLVGTNLFTANQRSVETNTTGFAAVDGAAISQSADYFYHGTKSLRVITSTTVNGVRGGVNTVATAVAIGGSYTGSFYILSPVAASFRCYLRNASTGTTGTPFYVTTSPYEWQRAWGTLTGVAAGQLVELYITEDVADSGVEFFVDALQLENSTLVSPFVDGVRSAISRAVYTGLDLFPYHDFTLSFWTSYVGTGAGVRYAVTITTSESGLGQGLQVGGSSTNLYLAISGIPGNLSTTVSGAFVSYVGKWIQVVLKKSEAQALVYVDGVLRLTLSLIIGSNNYYPSLDLCRYVQIGESNGGGAFVFPIDEVMILPWAADVATLANIRAATHSLALSPRLWAEGSFLPEGGGILCDAQLADSAFASYAGNTNTRRVSFALEEV
jgi:hypothetical protein